MAKYSDSWDSEVHENEQGAKATNLGMNFTLLPVNAIHTVVDVLTKGADRYGIDNWRNWTIDEHLNHALFHLLGSLEYGTTPEEQKIHISHAATRLLFALEEWDRTK